MQENQTNVIAVVVGSTTAVGAVIKIFYDIWDQKQKTATEEERNQLDQRRDEREERGADLTILRGVCEELRAEVERLRAENLQRENRIRELEAENGGFRLLIQSLKDRVDSLETRATSIDVLARRFEGAPSPDVGPDPAHI